MRKFATLLIVAASAVPAVAAPYNFDGTWIDVDYWAGSGANETIVVVDWNNTNGPYASESHAWGYRWRGTKTVLDALMGVAAAGAFDFEIAYGSFLNNAFYPDAADGDDHTTVGWEGWCWLAGSVDGGQTWDLNGGGIDVELLGDGQIEAANWNPGDWTGDNLNVPAPEPLTLSMLAVGGLAILRRRL